MQRKAVNERKIKNLQVLELGENVQHKTKKN